MLFCEYRTGKDHTPVEKHHKQSYVRKLKQALQLTDPKMQQSEFRTFQRIMQFILSARVTLLLVQTMKHNHDNIAYWSVK